MYIYVRVLENIGNSIQPAYIVYGIQAPQATIYKVADADVK